MNYQVCDGLCLDTAGTDGLTSEVSAAIPTEGKNAVQVAVVLYAFTATTLSMQVQVSNDSANWTNKGSAQTTNAIGRTIFSAEAAIAAAFVRLQFTVTGSGKAILDAHVAVSRQ